MIIPRLKSLGPQSAATALAQLAKIGKSNPIASFMEVASTIDGDKLAVVVAAIDVDVDTVVVVVVAVECFFQLFSCFRACFCRFKCRVLALVLYAFDRRGTAVIDVNFGGGGLIGADGRSDGRFG